MLINCVAYQEGKKLSDIPVERIGEVLRTPGTFVWVAMRDPAPEELEAMRLQFGLHELAVEDAQRGHQRPKIEEYGDCIFAVIHLVDLENGELVIGEVDVFVGHNYILSVRARSKQTFLGVRDRCEHEPHLLKQGSSFVLYALMDAAVDRYFPIVDALESEIEAIEEKIFEKGSQRANIERLYELKRKVATLRHAVVPLLEGVGKLYGGRVPAICANSQEYFRDVYDHLLRINASIDDLRDTATTAMQVNLSMVTIEESEVNKRLAAWAGIFAVATAFAGIWGMNFKHMPELEWEWGYPLALVTIATACGLLFWRFKKTGWL
ncbi:MAG: magnesium/cobalt transporter CorA [Tagaea sp.]|nr:magnesium/cobalt transporter CorA [Tagaea sp.]